jgi:hypothetical protein
MGRDGGGNYSGEGLHHFNNGGLNHIQSIICAFSSNGASSFENR